MNISNGQLWKYSSFIENNNYSFNNKIILNNIIPNENIFDYLNLIFILLFNNSGNKYI